MRVHTCSQAISFARELETESGKLYEALSAGYPQGADIFRSFPAENKKNITEIERAYYSVISDAIEGCFAFDLEMDQFKLPAGPDSKASYPDAIRRMIDIETRIVEYYTHAADQSGALLADVPRAFRLVVKKRNKRIEQLKSLL